jgi:hypothetical protein
MKQIIKGLLLVAVLLVGISASACEIKFKVTSGEKELYAVGDELVVVVEVVYTHKVCPEGIEATKFNFTGTKALGATKWTQLSEGHFERKFKLSIIEDKKDRHLFNAVRTCDKDGGNGTIKFNIE